MSIDITKSAVNSLTATLQDLGSADNSTSIAAGTTLPASNTVSTSVSLTRPNAKSVGIYRVSVNGTLFSNFNGKWYVHQGFTHYFSNDGSTTPTYAIKVVTSFTSTTVNIKFIFVNNTAADVSLPAITCSAHARFYTYPWST